MTRHEHNMYWGVDRKDDESVRCNLFGYGEISQYDSRCPACWLGNPHTWAKHDKFLADWLAARTKEDAT